MALFRCGSGDFNITNFEHNAPGAASSITFTAAQDYKHAVIAFNANNSANTQEHAATLSSTGTVTVTQLGIDHDSYSTVTYATLDNVKAGDTVTATYGGSFYVSYTVLS